MLDRRFVLSFGLAFLYLIIFYIVTYGMMLIDIIDDGVFTYNHLFIGFYQWFYLIPLIIYLKMKNRIFGGYLLGGICISGLNIALFIWIALDPDTFF